MIVFFCVFFGWGIFVLTKNGAVSQKNQNRNQLDERIQKRSSSDGREEFHPPNSEADGFLGGGFK